MVSFRGRVLAEEDGYYPRALVELNLRASIGAILSKPQWWRKWLSEDGVVRERWLRELEEQTIGMLLADMSEYWDMEDRIGVAFEKMDEFPVDGPDDEKLQFIRDKCATLKYEVQFHPEDEFSEDEEDDDDDDGEEEEEEEGGRESKQECRERKQAAKIKWILETNEKFEPFGQLLWYFTLAELTRQIKTRPVSDWPTVLETITWQPSIELAKELLMKIRASRLDKSTFNTWCPEADTRPFIMEALWFHIDKAMEHLNALRNCIIRTLDEVARTAKLTAASTGEGFISPGPVDETWMSDSLIPSDLKTAFVSQVAVLEVPEEKKDWHPGSDNQVLDLVHPSLYCCVFGKTKRVPSTGRGSDSVEIGVVERMERFAFKGTEVILKGSDNYWDDDYQWIPSDFAVDENGRVKIQSYINNLHPADHSGLYDSIASVFERFVPLFDRVLSYLVNKYSSSSQFDYSSVKDSYWSMDDFGSHPPHLPNAPERYVLEPDYAMPYSIKGTTIQVIVKIAEIHLTPEKPQYPGGSWHIEGSDSENIVATGLYYFGCDNITESKLSFRVIVQEPDEVDKDTLSMAAMYGLRRDEMLVQSLGAATAIEDRCLVFPNTLQHKVEPFELADPTKPGVRKILAFFLVDPTKTIPSTSVIPPQQEEWLQRLVAPMLEAKGLPVAAMEEQLTHLVSDGMTLEEAKRFRRELMDKRREYNRCNFEGNSKLRFSLCEH
ncbi:hypothetical protein Poli38472_013523 [Pythium oligandrum]|uniref:DUF4246 domain-containing protein n=1 Tax=Pythium oligandrum TaxID=41045 RepID=A0A8K1FEK8_PYTOL|nr:hypothetical protein Poli38472_013523 [Pythium oligandrum]|eukprot:TMW58049.1 hypothetical protein Poli38472_013523 [Pythium oligandrum]